MSTCTITVDTAFHIILYLHLYNYYFIILVYVPGSPKPGPRFDEDNVFVSHSILGSVDDYISSQAAEKRVSFHTSINGVDHSSIHSLNRSLLSLPYHKYLP